MRLNVNEEVYGINFEYKGEEETNMFFSMPNTFRGNKEVVSIRLAKLTVSEHHRVPSEWDVDRKPDCDGFILKDDKGVEWRNQWPVASYGQVSDTADRRYKLKEPTDEAEKAMFRVRLDTGFIPVYEYHQLQDVLTTFQEAIEKMEEIQSGLKDGSKDPENYIPEAQIEENARYHKELIKKITEQFAEQFPGKTIRLEKRPAFEESKTMWWFADIVNV